MMTAPKIFFEENICWEAFKIILLKTRLGNAGRKI